MNHFGNCGKPEKLFSGNIHQVNADPGIYLEFYLEGPKLNISKIANVRYSLLRTGSIATQFGIQLSSPIGRIPLLQTAVHPIPGCARQKSENWI